MPYSPPPVAARTVIDACCVEKTGVIYRIDPDGVLPGNLLASCVKPDKHIRLSRVDGEGVDHALLANLTVGDLHTQYLPVDGSRGMTRKLTTTDKIGLGTNVPDVPLAILLPGSRSNYSLSSSAAPSARGDLWAFGRFGETASPRSPSSRWRKPWSA